MKLLAGIGSLVLLVLMIVGVFLLGGMAAGAFWWLFLTGWEVVW